ncbi:MAG: YigZ family protein [Clostridia bacterium]|nr:YigZ family protein [Clostridia bacterium]
MVEEYYTVAGKSEGELVEKRSRFIATVIPVHTQEEAMGYIDALRSKYWDARHNVYAYTLLDGQIKRYSDDGEPSGTAGVPVLNVIEKLNLKDTLVVVTRYFGGILLGTGGLVRAYSQTAKIGVENAGVVRRCLCDVLKITVDYTLLGKVQKFLEQKEVKIKDISYSDTVTVSVLQTVSETETLIASLTELCDGKATFLKDGQDYADF